jgi:hypothetical protein
MATGKRKTAASKRRTGDESDPSMTAAQRRSLARQLEDMDDPTRYLLVSATLPGLSLYYVLKDDVWSLDDPSAATLFKRRAAARAIQQLLRPGVFVVPCTVDERGRLVLSSIANRKVGRLRLAILPAWRKKQTAGTNAAATRRRANVDATGAQRSTSRVIAAGRNG